MGFFSRMFIPRGVRRAMHPARTVKRAIRPKSVKRVQRAMHPIDNAVYALERSLNTKPRRRSTSHVYRQGRSTAVRAAATSAGFAALGVVVRSLED